MNGWIVGAVIVAVVVLGFLAQRFGFIDLSDKTRRRSGSGSGALGAMGMLDEVFSPTRHEAQVELDRQTILPAPAPLAGDRSREGRRGVYAGRVKIDLTDRPR